MKMNEVFQRWAAKLRHKTQSTVIRRGLYVSFAIHVGLLFVAAGFVISNIFYNRESTFVGQPPPMKTYEPRKVELKVKVQQKQRSSSRPAVVPRLVSSKPSSISMPDVKVDPKLVTTTFQPKFKAVTGMGMGVGLGTGYGTSGFGQGVSQVNFFGIKAGGERIAICVDVSVSMVEEERGGPAAFLQVKQRVAEVVDALKEGTLFNLIVFADGCSILDGQQMLYANPETRTKAKRFLDPFNTEGQYGLVSGNFADYPKGIQASGGTTRLDLAISAAMSQGADTILVISDGLPEVRKALSDAQIAAQAKRVADWQKANAATLAARDQAILNAPKRRVWVPAQPARAPSKKGLKEGQQPDPGAAATEGYWQEVTDIAPAPTPPPPPPAGTWTLADFVQHISMIYKDVYVEKGLKEPRIHCIGYQIDKNGQEFLKKLAAQYKGQFRLVRHLK